MQYIENERINTNTFATKHTGYSTGWPTWLWPPLPEIKQKPLKADVVDPSEEVIGKGAHMSILVYVEQSQNTHRSKEARSRRKINAEIRAKAAEERDYAKLRKRALKGVGEEEENESSVGSENEDDYAASDTDNEDTHLGFDPDKEVDQMYQYVIHRLKRFVASK